MASAISRQQPSEKHHFITTNLEHLSVRRCAEHLEASGWELTVLPSNSDGCVNAIDFQNAVRSNTRLASVIHASHQLGTIQPITEISEICQANDILLHTDASQTVGKMLFDVESLGVDLLSLSGHKFYAPKGIGGLYVRVGVAVDSIQFGDGNEGGLRPGTENVPHIVGLGQAARLVLGGAESSAGRLEELRDRFHRQLEIALGTPLRVLGQKAERLPHVLAIELPDVTSHALQQRLPEICFGAGVLGSESASNKRWNLVASLGLSDQQAARVLRLSIGWMTAEEELQQALQLIAAAHEGLN